MGARNDYGQLVAQCYAEHEDDASWLSAVIRAARPMIDRGRGIALSLLKAEVEGREFAAHAANGVALEISDKLRETVTALDDTSFQAMYCAQRPILLSSQRVSLLSDAGAEAYAEILRSWSACDCLGMIAHPAAGTVLAVIAPVANRNGIGRLDTAGLYRFLTHMEAAARLRFHAGEAIGVLDVQGRLVHAEDSALTVACDALRRQTRAIERARFHYLKRDADSGLASWSALVEGRWSLAERVERDGRRSYLVYANAPQTVQHRALSPQERSVAHYALQGFPGKQIAYALGMSQSRVSESLASAATKLGVRSREQLVALGTQLTAAPQMSADTLSDAERAIVSAVCAGLSNREIAKARGTSPHTVAKQVSRILQKLRVSSRRGLATVRLDTPMSTPKK